MHLKDQHFFFELWCLLPSGFKRFGHLSGTKMTNTCLFLWNVSSKIQFFTDISTFSVDVTFLKTVKCPNLLKPLGTIIQKNVDSSIP